MNTPPIPQSSFQKILIVEDDGLTAGLLLHWCHDAFVQLRPDAKFLSPAVSSIECKVSPTCSQARSIIRGWMPSLALIDIGLPDGSGLDLAAEWAVDFPSLRMIGMSAIPDEWTVTRVNRSPVHGFVAKSTRSLTELPRAIAAIQSGQTYRCSDFKKVADRVLRASDHFSHLLTPREETVLHSIANGLNDSEISQQIEISPAAVRKHRENLMRKFELHSSAKLIAKAWALGFGRVDRPWQKLLWEA